MTSGQSQLLMVGASHEFERYGQAGVEMSRAAAAPRRDRRRRGDRPVDAHRPDQPRPGRHLPPDRQPAAGPADAGLVGRPTGWGARTRTCPSTSSSSPAAGGQPLLSRYWGNGFLPSKYQGVSFRSTGDPVLYVSNPEGIDPAVRRQLLDGLKELNQIRAGHRGRPRDRRPDQLLRDGLPDADQRPRADGHRPGAEGGRRDVRRRRPARRRSPTTACSPAAWPSATSGSSSSTTATGTTTATCPTRSSASAT